MTGYNLHNIEDATSVDMAQKSAEHTKGAVVDGIQEGTTLRVAAMEGMTLQTMRDDELVQCIAAQDTLAFEELYQRYVRGCFGLAMKIVSDPAVAEEVVQDVFTKLWSQPHGFAPERGKFSGWLLTLVHNRSVDKLRRMKTGAGRVVLPLEASNGDSEASLVDILADPSKTPYDEAWSNETGQIVRQALSKLPETQREALTLAYFSGLTQKEIADRLQEPLGTIKTRTRSALHQLRNILAGQGLLGET